MKNLSFNYNVLGSISIMVEDTSVGTLTKEGRMLIGTIRYDGITQHVSYRNIGQAKEDVKTFFSNYDIYEF
tara:strand:+ start:2099 stop:2311 length:213 start_codon:yes stop_codon:yes gene_type:complete